jgi:hypothetical protein
MASEANRTNLHTKASKKTRENKKINIFNLVKLKSSMVARKLIVQSGFYAQVYALSRYDELNY